MRIALLGPLEVRDRDGALVEVAGARLRTLLILLALSGGAVAGTDRLIDGVWGGRPPATAGNSLQALVSRLRRTLPEATVESCPGGYRLVVGPGGVDVAEFEGLVARGRACEEPAQAARLLRAALALWRGPALLDAAGADFASAVVSRLDELRLTAVEARVDAELRLGLGAELVAELTALVAAHPLRERLAGALMRALCAAGRPAEALTVFDRTRTVLAEELGADPSPELSAVHTAVLRGEPARTNLRAGLTSFVGRDTDVARVRDLVGEYRLTTLTGPGGAGKTRLSVEVARALLPEWPDGVWLVELAPVGDRAGLAQAVLDALGVREGVLGGRGEPVVPAERLAAVIGARRVLVVLDNCEHVIDDAAAVADRLLGDCPRLRVLATSREPLGITGEAVWPVEPLALPPAGCDTGEAMASAAVRLLVDRARAARPGFTADAAALVRICRALDGMPLAIELAAARLRTMTVARLASRLDDRFRVLTAGSRVALPRHQTLRAVVDWSWDLLTAEERALLRRLAVFAGGATQEAVERVCAGGPVTPARVADLLTTLADKSLLTVAGERYGMLETIRAYGLARLDEAGERTRLRRAHAAYFTALAEAGEPSLRRREQLSWLRRLAADHDNLTAALRSAVAGGDAPTAARLVAAAGWYWWLSGHKAEGAGLAAEALDVPGDVDDETRAGACAIAALLILDGVRDEARAGRLFRTARALTAGRTGLTRPLLRLLGPIDRVLAAYANGGGDVPVDAVDSLARDEDPWVRGTGRLMHGHLLLNMGRRLADAESDFQAAAAEFRPLGERWGISLTLTSLADLASWRGEFGQAISHYDEALAVLSELLSSDEVVLIRVKLALLRRRAGDVAGSAAALSAASDEATRLGLPTALAAVAHLTGDLARWDGDLSSARDHLTRAVEIARNVTVAPQLRTMTLDSSGYVAVGAGDLAAARALHAESLDWAMRSLDAPAIAQALVGIANLALGQGDPARAAALLAASTAIRGTADLSRPDAATVEAATRAALGEHAFDHAWHQGATTTMTGARAAAAPVLS